MPLTFSFRETPIAIKNAKDADPNEIGKALHRISVDNHGRLTTRAALDAARNRRSPLHRHIEWNDKIAAEAHRRQQVSELIRLIVRDDPDDDDVTPQRMFLSIHDSHGTSYRTVDDILENSDLQLRVMQAALRDLKAWEGRYAELASICDLVRVARDRLHQKIQQTEARAQ